MEKSVTTRAASEELGHGSKVDGTVFYSETGMFVNIDLLAICNKHEVSLSSGVTVFLRAYSGFVCR